MSWANDITTVMRENGRSINGTKIKLAIMTGPNTVRVGNLDLLPQDLYIPDRLLLKSCTQVKEYAPDGGGNCTDQSTYAEPLKAGDQVLICQLSDSQFAILERVVKGA